MNLTLSYYKNCILSIHRGFAFGKPSNAKPLYLLAIIEGIEKGFVLGNKIVYDKPLESVYIELCHTYEPDRQLAPFYKPFFHSSREEYYHIKWISTIVPPKLKHTPTTKYIRENIEYAYLDDGFWDLLQDVSMRQELKYLLISHYLEENKNNTR